MRQARLVTFGIALAIGATLVACGGGGGGSNAPAVNAPHNPGGGTPPPTTTATSSPSGAPSLTPTPTPTPSPVQTAGITSAQIHIGYGQTNGNPQPLLVSSASNSRGYAGGGNLRPGDPGAQTTGGPDGNGGGGQGPANSGAVDGITCQPSMGELYHVHFFLGVYYQGQEVAVPAGVGMVNPSPPNQYIVNNQPTATPAPGTPGTGVPNQSWTADCYYDMHVHDNSGMVHVETTSNGQCGYYTNFNPAQPTATPAPGTVFKQCGPSPWSLKNFLDVWGISLTPTNFGPLKGNVQIYGTPPGYSSYKACGADAQNNVITPCLTNSSSYQLYYPNSSGMDPMTVASQIGLQSHTTIWIVVGTPLPQLPTINWDEGNP